MKRYKLHYVQPRDDGPQAVGKGSKNGGVPTGSTNDRCSASGKVAIEPPPSSSRTNSMASGGASAATAAAAMQSSGRRGGSKLRGKLKKHTNAISAAREFNRIGEAKKLERKELSLGGARGSGVAGEVTKANGQRRRSTSSNNDSMWILHNLHLPASTTLASFALKRVVGKGIMGTVWAAKWKKGGWVAIKAVMKDYVCRHNDGRHIQTERKVCCGVASREARLDKESILQGFC